MAASACPQGECCLLVGPSGSGKTATANGIIDNDPQFERVITATTRKPRNGEVDGVDYIFVSDEVFERMAQDGELLEENRLDTGKWYGLPRASIEKVLSQGKRALVVIDYKGAERVMSAFPTRSKVVFIDVPNDQVQLDRLKRNNVPH